MRKAIITILFLAIPCSAMGIEENMDLSNHIRVYLSSLIADAASIATVSPLDTEEVRAYSTDLIQRLQNTENSDDERAFFNKLVQRHSEIFPEDDGYDLSEFRFEMVPLLAELDDALAILTKGKDTENLRSELADLQSRLQLISEEQGLTEWLTRFDLFTAALLTHTIPTEPVILTKDVAVLLDNLSSYIGKLEAMNIDVTTLKNDVTDLITKLDAITSDTDFDLFMRDLETVLTVVPELENTNNNLP